MEEFTDDNFTFDGNGGKFKVENTVGKGEIARYEQFLLFPQCFQKTCSADTWKPGIVCYRATFIFLFRALRVRKKMCGEGQVINSIGDILCENVSVYTGLKMIMAQRKR